MRVFDPVRIKYCRVVFLPGIIRKQNQTKETRALLRLERTMNLIQGRGWRERGGRERGWRKGRDGGYIYVLNI